MTSFIAGITAIGVIYIIAKGLTLIHNHKQSDTLRTATMFTGLMIALTCIIVFVLSVSFVGDLALSAIYG